MLNTVSVTNTTMKWLKEEKLVDKDSSVQSAVETSLVNLIRKEEHATSVCTVLERWREWTDRGGMTIDDLEFLKRHKPSFQRGCVMDLLREMCTKEKSTVALDMRECIQHCQEIQLG